MALKIKENNGIYFAEGTINASTSFNLLTHLNHLINSEKSLTLNLDLVKNIDNNGVFAIYKAYKNALIKNVNFKLTGKKSNAILKQFNINKA
ncbi:hypothetical protein FUA26_00335 [Seonamhaeicola algicola]|uniref:STAS domain-containing protein n=1 Tax=Seonamhaeicola algicola TaxID=1719036 RepID=A0A5C7B1C6_9FLAO|nr:STAS domain-containing protein [Seonamhaeicola algicola]TXE14990.1 hypothetical protein FUA26_00335 [Seonamhaeicola algicola]